MIFIASIFLQTVSITSFINDHDQWEGIDDPVTGYDRILSIFPSTVSTLTGITSLLISVSGELYLFHLLNRRPVSFLEILNGISGIFNRMNFLFELIFFIFIIKISFSNLFFFAYLIFIIFISINFLIPIISLISIISKFSYVPFHDFNPFRFRRNPSDIVFQNLAVNSDAMEIPTGLNYSPNTTPPVVLKLAQFCLSTDYQLVYYTLLTQYLPLPAQPGILLSAATRSYLKCLSFDVLIIPIKIFFLLDFCPNPVLIFSMI